MPPQDNANHGQVVADQLRAAADSMSAMADLVKWALADLVAAAVALENGQTDEDDLLGAVDQYIVICKLPRPRRSSRRECND